MSRAMADNAGELAKAVLRELEQVVTSPSATLAVQAMVRELTEVSCRNRKVFLYGVGREGLMMKALTMRLFHLGLPAHYVGDVTTPASTQGDLILLSAGPGGFATVDSLAALARCVNTRVVMLTAQPFGSASRLADVVLHVPAQTMADDAEHDGIQHNEDGDRMSSRDLSLLPMGSLYEASLFLIFELAVLKLQESLGVTLQEMRSRHTNLE